MTRIIQEERKSPAMKAALDGLRVAVPESLQPCHPKVQAFIRKGLSRLPAVAPTAPC